MSNYIDDGKYEAVVKAVSPYFRKNEHGSRLSVALKLYIPSLDKEIMSRQALELNDGSISTRTLENLRKVFPLWDGQVESLLVASNFEDAPCEVVIEQVERDGKSFSNVKWVNPLGGGGQDVPETASKQELLSKYGSKFRALAGGKKSTPAAKPAPKQEVKEEVVEEDPVEDEAEEVFKPTPVKAPAKKAPAKKEKVEGRAAPTMEDCWNMLNKRKPKEAEELWATFIAEVGGDKDYSDITGEEWSRIMSLCDGTNSLE